MRLACGVLMKTTWRPIDTVVRVISVPFEKILNSWSRLVTTLGMMMQWGDPTILLSIETQSPGIAK